MKKTEEFLQSLISIKPIGPDLFQVHFPMYKVEGIMYKIYLVAEDGKYYLSDMGVTYARLDEIFEIKEPAVIKNLVAILKQYSCYKDKKTNAFKVECTPDDIHLKLSSLIQALSFMLNMKIFYY
jgi:hypothetical protein